MKVVDYCASGRRFYFATYKEISFQPEEVLEQICIAAGCVVTPVHYYKHQFPSLWLLWHFTEAASTTGISSIATI